MSKLELMQRSLYSICRYDYDTKDYVKYNRLLWQDIQKLDIEAVEDAIKTLMECNL